MRPLEYFDRPTPLLDCPEGVADWVRMFGAGLIATADYRRLRVLARRPADGRPRGRTRR